MSSDRRRLKRWHWLLLAVIVLLLLAYLGTYTLEPAVALAAG
jgi:hypothetical protein